MAEKIIIDSFSNNALKQIETYLGATTGEIQKKIISSTRTNDSTEDDNGDKLSKIDDEISRLKQQLSNNETELRESRTKHFREEVETNAKVRSEWRRMLKSENEEILKRIKTLERESDILRLEVKVEEEHKKAVEIVNSKYELRNKLEKQHIQYVSEHLEKYQKIAEIQEKIATFGQKVDDKVDNLSYGTIFGNKARRNSFAEINKITGEVIKQIHASVTGDSFFRNVGNVLGGVSNTAAKGGAFINAGKMDVGALADKMTGALSKAGPWGAATGGIIQILKTAFDMYSKVNTAASKFARTVGGGAATIQRMEFSMAKVAKEISTSGDKWVSWNQRAYDAAKLLESAAEYSSAIGRTTEYLSKADFKALQDLKDYGVSFDIVSQFDTFGISASEVSEKLANLYGTAGKHGLNAKAVSDTVTKNLKMAQQYTFAGGVRALERMAEKAVMLKYNMESVSRFAEKVSTLEGAVQSAAGLSVLGGNFARMANPLSMLYGGLQDPERLNEMMLNMTKGMAQWDSKKGQFDMAGVDRVRLKAAAEQMGVDFNDLYNMAVNQTRQQMVDKQIGGNVDEETRKYIRNIATIKDGKAVVSLGGEERDVSRLTQADKERLKKESEEKEKRDGATLGDILGETRSTQEKLDEIIEQIKNKLVFGVMALVDRFTKGNLFSNSNNTYADMARYGMSQEATEQYNRIRRIKENPNSAESIYSVASKEDKAAMRALGWFDDTGKYVGSKATTSNEDELEMFKKHFVEAQRAKEKEDREKKAYGGIIRGKGTSKSDSIPAWLSNGEFVVNASATSKHLPELQAMNAEGFSRGTIAPIRAGKNQYNLGTSVLPPMLMSNVGVGDVQHVTIDPLQVSGTLTLNVAGGGSKTINANELFTQENVNILLRKLQESLGFRLDKTEFRMPKFI